MALWKLKDLDIFLRCFSERSEVFNGRITALLWIHFNYFTLDEASPVSDGMLYEMSRTGFAEF